MRFVCTVCQSSVGDEYRPFCACGGMVEVEYDLARVKLGSSSNPYVRFADLLPIASSRDRLPQDATFSPTIHAKALGSRLGMPSLYLKNETVLPTRTTKDRMAAVSLAFLWERGVRSFCTSSTGNSSTAYADAIRAYPDMELYLFTAENFVTRVQHADHPQVHHFGMRDATFVDAFNYAGVYAQEHGLISERGFFNLGRREGLKLAFFEACEQVPQPIDWYVQAVSSAMGVYGTYKGARELLGMKRIGRLPKLMCAQQERCSPMVRAYADGHEAIQPHHVVHRPTGIAEAILRGDPSRVYPYVRGIVVESGGDFVSVTDDEIREARSLVENLEGISPCFSASTAVAALIKQVRRDRFPTHETVLVNLTGGDRPRTGPGPDIRWFRRNQHEWIEESQTSVGQSVGSSGSPPRPSAGRDASLRLSVVVPFRRNLSHLASCLSAVRAAAEHLPDAVELTDITVVADGAIDDPAELAQQVDARVVRLDGPVGPATARNRGAALAAGDILVLVDADVVMHDDALARMAARFLANPDLAAVFGAYDDTPADPGFFSQCRNLAHAFVHRRSAAEARTFWAGLGAVRASAFAAVHGFDERFRRPVVEDIDLGYRMTAAGFRIALDPGIEGCHLKRWTLYSSIVSDVRDRGVPWAQLLNRYGSIANDLNLTYQYRACVASAYLLVAILIGSAVRPELALAAPLLIVALWQLDRPYYRFFVARQGWPLALCWFPFHVFHHLCNGVSFVVGSALYYTRKWTGVALPGSLPVTAWPSRSSSRPRAHAVLR